MCPARSLSFPFKEVPGFRKQRSRILASFKNSGEAGSIFKAGVRSEIEANGFIKGPPFQSLGR